MGLSARQNRIADAAVAVASSGGARALTHRAVDQEAGIPLGSTSFYARTRQDLLQLTVQRITATTASSLEELTIRASLGLDASMPRCLDASMPRCLDASTDLATRVFERLSSQTATHRARVALLLELEHGAARTELTASAPVRALLLGVAEQLLTALDVDEPRTHRTDLVGLVDALLLYASLDIAPIDARRTLNAYLCGLPRSTE